MNNDEKKNKTAVEFTDILRILRRHIALILLAGIIGAAGGYGYFHFLVQPVYEASAKMIVNSRQDQNANITNDQITSAQKLVDTYSIIIRSRTVLVPVIDKLQLSASYENLHNRVLVSSVEGTQIMEISVRDEDPALAQEILTEIVNLSPDIILNSVEAGSVKTVESPYCKSSPVAPRKGLNALLTAVISVAVVVVVLLCRFLMDNTFATELDIQDELGIPVLGVIPTVESCSLLGDKRHERGKKKT